MLKWWREDRSLRVHRAWLRETLQFWTRLENLVQWNPVRPPPPSAVGWTDASLSGWGAHTEEGKSIYGSWTEEEARLHINLLEIRAVSNFIKSDLVKPNSSWVIYTDSTTAFFAINKQGSSRVINVTKEVGKVRYWMKEKELAINMKRVPGKMNVIADSLSRGGIAPGEWEISERDWQRISAQFSSLEIDMMATPFNNKLEKFISPFPHPRATDVDALGVDWNRWRSVYVFPPLALLPRVVAILEGFTGSAGECKLL